MAVVVSDTSPVRALQHLGLAHLLRDLFGTVLIPPAVAAELTDPAAGVPPIDPLTLPAVRVQAPTDADLLADLMARLDPGEAEALCLAVEVRASAVLIDESAVRKHAARLGLAPLGALGVLVRAKDAGLIERIGPLIAELERGINFHISDSLRAIVLKRAGEAE